MQKCFERIVTHDIPDCLVIINANKNSMTILEADQLQILFNSSKNSKWYDISGSSAPYTMYKPFKWGVIMALD
jgi:hypothetical protein